MENKMWDFDGIVENLFLTQYMGWILWNAKNATNQNLELTIIADSSVEKPSGMTNNRFSCES